MYLLKFLRGGKGPARLSINISIIFSLLFLLSSCEESSFVGLEIQPEEDRFRVRSVADLDINSSLWTRDSLIGVGYTRSVLGEVNDPVFGRLRASFMTQVGIASQPNFGTNPLVDSLVLHLRYVRHYGDVQSPQDISIYEVSTTIDSDSAYYSNLDPLERIFDQELLASKTIIRQEGDSMISIPITNNVFQNKLLNAPDSVTGSIGAFITYFKGLYVTADLAGETGAFFTVNLNDAASRLTMYYRNTEFPDSTLQFNYVIQDLANRINLFDYDHSQAVFYPDLGQTGTADTVYYAQGGGGVMGRLDFGQLHAWRDSMPVSINSAKLILPVETADGSTSVFPRPARLTVFERNPLGNMSGIIDMAIGDNYFGGTLNAQTGEYTINLSSWVQDFIMKEDAASSLYVNIRDAGINPDRVVLRSRHHSLGGPRLEIVYTRH
jgi:hypothetical protein